MPVGGWRIVFDAAVKRVMRTYRSRRLPNDTGGVLLGAFDLVRKSVFISDVLSSPDDSREWPTVYIRGSAGLRLAVQNAERLTQGGLERRWRALRRCQRIQADSCLYIAAM